MAGFFSPPPPGAGGKVVQRLRHLRIRVFRTGTGQPEFRVGLDPLGEQFERDADDLGNDIHGEPEDETALHHLRGAVA